MAKKRKRGRGRNRSQSTEELEESAAKRGLAAEIKRLVSSIDRVVSELKHSVSDDTWSRLRSIRNDGKRINALVAVLSAAASNDTDELQPVDLADVVAEGIGKVGLDGLGGASTQSDLEEGLTVLGDHRELKVLVGALVRNAVESGATTVWLKTRSEGEHAVVEVIDDGPGIPPELMSRIFRPGFSQTGRAGMGLAVVDDIVRHHRAQMQIETATGDGTSFSIELPLYAAPTEPPALERAYS